MADFREQRACIKFCFKLGKTAATEYYEMLKIAVREQAMGRSQTFQWLSRFKAGRTSIDDDERSGRPVHQCIIFSLFWNDTLHVSDGLSVHHRMPVAVCTVLNS